MLAVRTERNSADYPQIRCGALHLSTPSVTSSLASSVRRRLTGFIGHKMSGTTSAILLGLGLLLASDVAQAESIPLIREHGIFMVPVVINDKITLNFTIDSGAADVSIPADVFSTLTRTGTISKSDLLGTQVYELADGTQQRSQRFRIRSLRIGNLELQDVTASVAPAAASLLLGQSFLERFKYWSIDNQRHVMLINETPLASPAGDSQVPNRVAASVSRRVSLGHSG